MTCQWNVIYAGPTRMAPRLLWGSIRCLRIIPVRSWPRISTKGNGEEMSSLLGTPASVTKFLLPLSGRDPETVLTLGSFSRSRYACGTGGRWFAPTLLYQAKSNICPDLVRGLESYQSAGD